MPKTRAAMPSDPVAGWFPQPTQWVPEIVRLLYPLVGWRTGSGIPAGEYCCEYDPEIEGVRIILADGKKALVLPSQVSVVEWKEWPGNAAATEQD